MDEKKQYVKKKKKKTLDEIKCPYVSQQNSTKTRIILMSLFLFHFVDISFMNFIKPKKKTKKKKQSSDRSLLKVTNI